MKLKIQALNEEIDALRYYNAMTFEELINQGNSERLSRALAGVGFITTSAGRVYREENPHIEEALLREVVNGWRVDFRNDNYFFGFKSQKNGFGLFEIDIEKKTARRILTKGQAVCKTCGAVINKADKMGVRCVNCMENFLTRYGYHCFNEKYRIDKHKKGEILFGCEIERDYLGTQQGDFSENLKGALWRVCQILYSKQLKTTGKINREAVFMSDGSLNCGGVEWITFPKPFSYYKKNKEIYQEILKTFREFGFADSDNAGLHIHIGRDYFKNSSEAGALMGGFVCDNFDFFKKIARRENTDYCYKTRQTLENGFFDLVEKSFFCRDEHGAVINMQHSNTIEFRVFSAVRTAQDILNAIDYTKALAKVGKMKFEKVKKLTIKDYIKLCETEEARKFAFACLGGEKCAS